jgi:hypothetical protein
MAEHKSLIKWAVFAGTEPAELWLGVPGTGPRGFDTGTEVVPWLTEGALVVATVGGHNAADPALPAIVRRMVFLEPNNLVGLENFSMREGFALRMALAVSNWTRNFLKSAAADTFALFELSSTYLTAVGKCIRCI